MTKAENRFYKEATMSHQITDDEKIHALVKQLNERDQTIKELREALKEAVDHWYKLDIGDDYDQEIENARKLIEP